MKKFVILSDARSGTSLLGATLNTHPEIVCHGEIFHPDPTWHLKGTLQAMSTAEKIELQKNDPDFVALVFDQPGFAAVGIKMWHDQNPEWCGKFLEDTSCFKIIYERSNKLAQFSSGQLARMTNVWNLGIGKKNDTRKVERLDFNGKHFAAFLAHQNETFRKYRTRARGPVMELRYKDIAAGEFASVLGFLHVKDIVLQPQKRQLYSGDILSRFKEDQHDEIRMFLKDMGREDWVGE